MSKIAFSDIPAAWLPLVEKILGHFNLGAIPTQATLNRTSTRSKTAANQQKTVMPSAAASWRSFDAPTKLAWKTTANFHLLSGTALHSPKKLSGYALFLKDFSYRKKYGLSLPGSASQFYLTHGLLFSNPGAETGIMIQVDAKDRFGPIRIRFNYKKDEIEPTTDKPFGYKLELWHFEAGQNVLDTFEWTSPSGNVDWTAHDQSYGLSGQDYFHLRITFSFDGYNADVYLAKFLWSDVNDDIDRQSFFFNAGKEWAVNPYYRKEGWLFYPEDREPYFRIVYLNV